MTSNEARVIIIEAFKSGWASLSPAFFDNQSAKPPTNSPWVRLHIYHLPSSQASLGAAPHRIFERNGMIAFEINTPLGVGDFKTDELFRRFLTIFEAKTISGIRFRSASLTEKGALDGWNTAEAEVQFQYDEER